MALEPKRGERDKDTEGSDFTAANYHNHSKMSRHRFEFIILVLANTLLWMSVWKGSETAHRVEGMPRKTEGVGAEMKSLCDSSSGILLRLEGKQRQATMEFHGEYGEGTVVTFCLTKDYCGINRTVHADSAFSSMKTSEVLQSTSWALSRLPTKGFPRST